MCLSDVGLRIENFILKLTSYFAHSIGQTATRQAVQLLCSSSRQTQFYTDLHSHQQMIVILFEDYEVYEGITIYVTTKNTTYDQRKIGQQHQKHAIR